MVAKIPPGVGPQFPQVLVLVGATGDLARRKLLPGLFHLASSGFIPGCRIIGVIPHAKQDSSAGIQPRRKKQGARVFAYLASKASRGVVEKTVEAAFQNIELSEHERASREALKIAEREREELNQIGMALSTERDISMLLSLILSKAREITGADAGSLYLVEEEAEGRRHLRFMLTQNDSLDFPFQEFVMPLAEDSMAGYTAVRGEVLNFADAYKIPRGRPYHFNESYDRESGYRTRSLLTLPMLMILPPFSIKRSDS